MNVLSTTELLIDKYRPTKIEEINITQYTQDFIRNLIDKNTLNINIIGNTGTGKSSLINIILLKYYAVDNINNKCIQDNVLFINNLKEQGITYFKHNIQTFCLSLSDLKKKTIVIDNIDLMTEQYQALFVLHLDKFSKNVNFIISCTNENKLLYNIISHTIKIYMSNINPEFLTRIYNTITTKTQFNNLQSVNTDKILNTNQTIKGLINELEILRIIDKDINDNNRPIFNLFICSCFNHHITVAIQTIIQIYECGYSVIDILDYLYFYIKTFTNDNEQLINYKYEFIKVISKYMLLIHNIYEEPVILKFLTFDLCKVIIPTEKKLIYV